MKGHLIWMQADGNACHNAQGFGSHYEHGLACPIGHVQLAVPGHQHIVRPTTARGRLERNAGLRRECADRPVVDVERVEYSRCAVEEEAAVEPARFAISVLILLSRIWRVGTRGAETVLVEVEIETMERLRAATRPPD